MAKRKPARRRKPAEMEEFVESDAGEQGEKIIEYDASRASKAALADVQEALDDPAVTVVESQAFDAVRELERAMGGFETVAAALGSPADDVEIGPENIVGFGVGEKTTGGRYTGEVALKVYVVEKAPLEHLEDESIAPREFEGYPVDVEQVGEVYAESFRRRYRPAPGGSSIGHPSITAGTHGCLVVLNNNRLCCLSNNHVMANSNSANIGDPVLQPGPADGGANPADRVGVLQAFIPIDFHGGANLVDAAVAWTSTSLLSARHHCYQINTTPIQPALNMMVRKCGRTTQHTLGHISGLGVSIRVNYRAAGVALFRNQIQITGSGGLFSQGGDSGSLVVTAGTRQPVGLLFAGGGNSTFANPVAAVISALGIQRFLNAP